MVDIIPVSAQAIGQNFIVRYHPDGGLQVGDQVSMEVISPPGMDVNNQVVQVSLQQKELGTAKFGGFTGGRSRAILQWVWDTRGLAANSYTLVFSIPERLISWQEMVHLSPTSPDAASHQWATKENQCCLIHYITGTAAERDINSLSEMIDAQAQDASQKLGAPLGDKLNVNLIPRVLGQGGFASNEVYVSYRDDNYDNPNVAQLIHHELIHRIDANIKSDLRPSLLVEGLAVYLSGGHYTKEPVMQRAVSLVNLGTYLPLPYLIDQFYPSQHETGYIEGAALIEYMVNSWGWDAFNSFYRDIHPINNAPQSKAIDAALQAHFNLTLEQLDNRFIGFLEETPLVTDVREDVEATVRYYDAIRDYQKQLDPSAYFEQVWLPDAKQMRDRGIVADYLRGPEAPINQMVEGLFLEAGNDLRKGDYSQVFEILSQIQNILFNAPINTQLIVAEVAPPQWIAEIPFMEINKTRWPI